MPIARKSPSNAAAEETEIELVNLVSRDDKSQRSGGAAAGRNAVIHVLKSEACRKWLLPVLGGALLIGLFYLFTEEESLSVSGPVVEHLHEKPARSIAFPISLHNMSSAFEEARQRMTLQLQTNYGKDGWENMFHMEVPSSDGTTMTKQSVGRLFLASPGDLEKDEDEVKAISWDRMKRRLMMKLLHVHRITGYDTKKRTEETEEDDLVPFVWATGGHSASAAHGNLFRESYTAEIERMAGPVFRSVGLKLVGRNYAMGGTASAQEIAWCHEAIFGTDVDVVSWDFGMLDGKQVSLLDLFCRRAAVSPSRPACVGLQVGGWPYRLRVGVLAALEQQGMTTLHAVESVFSHIKDAIPDTSGLTDAQVAALPAFVRYLKCNKQIENGDPGCSDYKFNNTVCSDRKAKTSWHPGWKWHALVGNLLGLSLVEMLQDAIEAIRGSTSAPGSLLMQLMQEEAQERERFLQTPVPTENVEDLFGAPPPVQFNADIMYKNPNICHTARLPAETRYLGILTDTTRNTSIPEKGKGTDGGDIWYEIGTSQKTADATPNPGNAMRLVNDEGSRQDCTDAQLNMDFKDFFYVHQQEGWKSVLLPNAAETKAYREPRARMKNDAATAPGLKGMVAVCFVVCDWNKCPPGNLVAEDLLAGRGEIQVNGVKVTNVVPFQNKLCELLQGPGGQLFFQPDANGKYEIRAQAIEANSYFRFSSFIVW